MRVADFARALVQAPPIVGQPVSGTQVAFERMPKHDEAVIDLYREVLTFVTGTGAIQYPFGYHVDYSDEMVHGIVMSLWAFSRRFTITGDIYIVAQHANRAYVWRVTPTGVVTVFGDTETRLLPSIW